jgi:hypothetical protein
MRLSLMKAAHVALSGTAYRKYGLWGTRHSLRIEISLPDHRFPRGL